MLIKGLNIKARMIIVMFAKVKINVRRIKTLYRGTVGN